MTNDHAHKLAQEWARGDDKCPSGFVRWAAKLAEGGSWSIVTEELQYGAGLTEDDAEQLCLNLDLAAKVLLDGAVVL